MRILVADDDPTSATITSRSLQRWGLDVVVADNGDEAWRMIQDDDRLGMATVDWMMPGLDGLELCRRIRQRATPMHVIMLTSRDARIDVVQGLDAGADDYLVKPFDLEELRARVHVGLRILTLQARLAAQVQELNEALSSVKQLRGLLPICSYCKRIRSDKNYWQQVDHYIAEHTTAQFSHGICPSCYQAALAQIEGSSL
jgi:DNA-binding response OmpR family regulator